MSAIRKEISVDEFRQYARSFCDDHAEQLGDLTDDVLASVEAVVDAHIEVKETWEDSSSKIIVRLADGTYGCFSEWSDSTGHGCRCGAGWSVHPTLEAAQA